MLNIKRIKYIIAIGVGLLFLSACASTLKSEPVWKFDTQDMIWNTPIVNETSVFVGNHTGLYAVNRETGEKRWDVHFGEKVYISPASMAENMLYFGVNRDNHLYGVNTQTGEVILELGVGERDIHIILPPVIANSAIYFSTNDGMLNALDIRSQKIIWSSYVSLSPDSGISVIGDTIYIAGNWQGYIYAIDSQTGEQRWRYKTNSQGASNPIVVDGTVYFGSGDGHLYALDIQTGEKRWRFSAGKPIGGLSYADGILYISCEDHYVYAIDKQTGKKKWQFDAKGGVVSSPLIVNGQVCFGSLDGHLYVVNAKTGRQEWKFLTGDMVNASPVEANGVIYFGSNDGYLYAVASDKER